MEGRADPRPPGKWGFRCADSGLSALPRARPHPAPSGQERGPPRIFANPFDPLALHLGGAPRVFSGISPCSGPWWLSPRGGDREGKPRPGQNVTQKFLSGTPKKFLLPASGRGGAVPGRIPGDEPCRECSRGGGMRKERGSFVGGHATPLRGLRARRMRPRHYPQPSDRVKEPKGCGILNRTGSSP